jgi:hypothetical protein
VSTIPKLVYLQRRKYSFNHGDGFINPTGTLHPLDQGYQQKKSDYTGRLNGDPKHIKEDGHWIHPTTKDNRYEPLSDCENNDHLQKVAAYSTPKPSPIFVSDVITIPPLLQLLDHIVKQPYEIETLAGNQVRIQPKTPNPYKAIIKALVKKTRHSILTNLNMNAITG